MSVAVLNLYSDAAMTQAYSKAGAFTFPIWKYPPWAFNGRDGQTRFRKVYLRNDGPTIIGTISGVQTFQVAPVDTAAEGRQTYIKLALTEAGLAAAGAGDALSLADLTLGASTEFYVQVTTPASAEVEDIRDIVLRFSGCSIPTGT